MKKCKFCFEEIQDEAIKCKHCGSSLQESNSQSIKQQELTNPKKGKNTMVKGALLTCLGIIFLIVGISNEITFFSIIGSLGILFGLVIYFVGRMTHWYNWK